MPQSLRTIAQTDLGIVGLDFDNTLWLFKPEMKDEQPTGKFSWVKLELANK